MSGNTSEAENTFERAKKQRFPEEEARRVRFRPTNLSDPQFDITATGTVIVRKFGYLLIQSQEFGKLLSASPKIEGIYVKEQTAVKFIVAYTAKGGVALNPRIVR